MRIPVKFLVFKSYGEFREFVLGKVKELEEVESMLKSISANGEVAALDVDKNSFVRVKVDDVLKAVRELKEAYMKIAKASLDIPQNPPWVVILEFRAGLPSRAYVIPFLGDVMKCRESPS